MKSAGTTEVYYVAKIPGVGGDVDAVRHTRLTIERVQAVLGARRLLARDSREESVDLGNCGTADAMGVVFVRSSIRITSHVGREVAYPRSGGLVH